MKIVIAPLVALAMVGCSSQRPILDFSEIDSFRSELQRKTISLVVLRGINLLDFRSSFESAYGSNQKFASDVMKNLSLVMEGNIRQPIADTLYIDETKDGDSNDKKDYFVKGQLPKLKSELAIVFSQFEIGQRSEFSEYNNSNSINNVHSNSTTTYSSSEYCQIVIRTDIWDVRKKRKLASFSSLADSKVFLWFYATALTGAVDNSIKQIADVLNDEVKFKDY